MGKSHDQEVPTSSKAEKEMKTDPITEDTGKPGKRFKIWGRKAKTDVAGDGDGNDADADADTKKNEDNGSTVKNFIRILSYGSKLDFLMMGLCTLSAIGSGAAMPLMFLVFGGLVGNFTSYFQPGTTVTKQAFMSQVSRNTLYMVYIGIARFVLSYISMFCIRMSGLRISAKLRLAYLKALFRQPVSEIDSALPGKIAARLTTNSNIIQMGISQQFNMAIQAVSFTVGLYVVSFVKSALLTLVASATLPVILICYGAAVPFVFKNLKASEKHKEKAASLAFEIFESIRIVTAFGAEKKLTDQHRKMINDSMKDDRKNGPLMGILMAPMFFAVYATFSLTFWFGIRQVQRGKLDGIGSIVIVLFSVNFAVTSIGRLFTPILAMVKAASSASEIFATIDADVPDMSGVKEEAVDVTKDIVFKDVTFAYPSRPDTIILDKLNLRFETGKTTAIVGTSGSGKSTIVALLQRWYHPTVEKLAKLDGGDEIASAQGSENMENAGLSDKVQDFDSSGIFIGGINLNDIDAKWWRTNVGLVQQEPFLFNDTIYSNVAHGLSGSRWLDASEEEKRALVEKACTEAFADDFIQKLPEGYETMVGESGIKLSGGQRQRLAIARAIVKEPPILILDEATSSIDVRTERIVQQALDRVSVNRTTITIAHRLSTIKRANKIVVLRGGLIAEQGTHDELVQREEGIYSGLVRAQALEMGKDEYEEAGQDGEMAQLQREETNKAKEKESKIDAMVEPEWKQRGVVRSFGLLVYEQRNRWFLYAITLFGSVGAGATYPLQAYLFANIVNVFTFSGSQLTSKGNFWSLMFFIEAIAVFIFYFALGWAAHLVSIAVAAYYRQEYLQNILKKRIVFFDSEGKSAGSLTSRLSTDSVQLQELLGMNLAMALISIFNLLGSISISFAFGWKLSLVGILAIMPIVLSAGYLRVRLEMGFEKLNSAVFAESSQFGSEAIGAFRTVTAMGMEDTITDRFEGLLKTHVTSAFMKARFSTMVFAFSDSAEMLCQALCFWYGGTLLASREYNITKYFVIYMAVVQGSQAAGTWFSFAPNIVEATAAANRILGIRPTKVERDDRERRREMPLGEGAIGVELKDLHFSYRDRDVPVLSGLSLKIEPGQFAAFVGASGCGKSTIISLLERFYDPTSGQILFGDTDISEVDAESYRKNLSLVAQESTLYEGSIRDNVALSVDDSAATDAAVEEACKSAQIHDFIMSLPDGYATVIGPRGITLSGGQRQRLALGRALLRRPQLLLLDESTSNLDSESEKHVQAAIEKAAGEGGRTIIAVAHRLATIQRADVIFVIGSGKVLESGSHSELLALGKNGLYFQMCQSQALDR